MGNVSDVTGAVVGGIAHIGTSTTLAGVGGAFNGAYDYFTGESTGGIGRYMGTGRASNASVGEPDAELEDFDDSGVIVPAHTKPIFAWGINTYQTQHVRSELERMSVVQLRKKLRDHTSERTPELNSLIKGMAVGGMPGWRKEDIIEETLKLNY